MCCIARLWDDFQEAKWAGIRESAHERLCVLLTDPVPEVRMFFSEDTLALKEEIRFELLLFMLWEHSLVVVVTMISGEALKSILGLRFQS